MPALFRRRRVWLPTWWVALLFVVAVAAAIVVALRGLGLYLAPSDPAAGRDGRGARTLIVEGWLDEHALDAAIAVIGRGGYERVVTSGGPIDGWRESERFPTYAERAADYLRRRGVSAVPVTALAAPDAPRDRTFLAATVVRDGLRQFGAVDAVDLFSSGVHARRSRVVYRLALGPAVEVGVVAAPPRGYDLARWWTTSEGAKAVLDEAIALAWTACCFSPAAPGSDDDRRAAPRSPA